MESLVNLFTPSRPTKPVAKAAVDQLGGSTPSSGSQSSEDFNGPDPSGKDKERTPSPSPSPSPSPPRHRHRRRSSSGDRRQMMSLLENISARLEALEKQKSLRTFSPDKELPLNFPSSSLKTVADQEKRRKRRQTIFETNRRLNFDEEPLDSGTSPLSTAFAPFTSSTTSTVPSAPPLSPSSSPSPSLSDASSADLVRAVQIALALGRQNPNTRDESVVALIEEVIERERTRSTVNENLGIRIFTPKMRENPGFSNWYRRLDTIFEKNRYSEQQCIDTLIFYTDSSTRTWMDTLHKEEHNLKSYLTYFALYWNPTTSETDWEKSFRDRLQQRNERIEEYAREKIALFNRAYVDDDYRKSTEFRKYFVSGLQPVWHKLLTRKNYLKSDYSTIFSFLLMRQMEDAHNAAHAKQFAQEKPLRTPKDSSSNDSPKTKVCPFFLKGSCKKGKRCDFLHHRPKKENPSSTSASQDSASSSKISEPEKSPKNSPPRKYTPEELAAPCIRKTCDKKDNHILGKCPNWKKCPVCEKPGHHRTYCPKK